MPNLAFGSWGEEKRWGWRVEWFENGEPKTRDFLQEDLKPGKAKADADQFTASLTNDQVA